MYDTRVMVSFNDLQFYDDNDKFAYTMPRIISPASDPTFEADVVAYIKSRMASIPGVGNITATRSVITKTNV